MKSNARFGPNTASKDVLARCMATEDIRVKHDASSPTAYFDVENRVLCLPVWKDMDDATYDMLVGHEVSHALHTPATGWQDFVGEGAGSGTRHMFINCVEDARIERLIKDKFPGLRRDFSSAYKSLHEQDLFEIAGRDISELPLIDRLNLHFKVGLFGLENVPFSTDEKQYVARMGETESFEEVIQLASDLYDLYKDEQQSEQDQNGTPDSSGDGQQGESQQTSGDQDGDQDGEQDGAGSSSDQDGDQDGNQDGNEDTGSVNRGGDDSGQSQSDDTDDGESADSENGEQSAGGDATGGLSYDDYSNNPTNAGSTQHNYEKGIQEFRDENADDWRYHTLPQFNVNSIICTYKEIEQLWVDMESNDRFNSDLQIKQRNTAWSDLATFLNESKATVNHMVQQFQMKQAADASKRTSLAQTGVLDTIKMVNYRWSEDIFRKNEVHADGKNHGIVMFLDWSGSMGSILNDTAKQLLVLVEFCRKVGIPYEVYAFSSNTYAPNFVGDRYSDEYIDNINKWHDRRGEQFTKSDDATDVQPHAFTLYNFLSSKMTSRDYKTALRNFWIAVGSNGYRYGLTAPSCLSTGCTPLNESIAAALQIVPEFQRTNNIQITNAVFLTDGDGHSMGIRGYGYGRSKSKDILVDKKTHKTYDVDRNVRDGETQALLQLLKDKTGCNTIGIRLHDSKNIRNLRYNYWNDDDAAFDAASKSFNKNNFAITDSIGYDENFIVKGQLKVEFDALENVDADASYAKIKNAFIKGNTCKKTSRVIASKLIDIIAT